MTNITVLTKAASLSKSSPDAEKLLLQLFDASDGNEILKILDSFNPSRKN